MNKEKAALRELSTEQLHEKLGQTRHELFGLRLQNATSHIKDNSQFRKLRKTIARVLTMLEQEKSKGNNGN